MDMLSLTPSAHSLPCERERENKEKKGRERVGHVDEHKWYTLLAK